MKFSVQLALACFSAGVLSNVTPRHPIIVQKVLGECREDVVELDAAVKVFQYDPSPIQDATNSLVDTIVRGNAEIAAQATLSLPDTLELDTTVTIFITHVKTLIDDLKAKRDVVKAALKCGLIRENIEVINTAAFTLITTIVGKCNPLAHEIAEKQKQAFETVLIDCKDYYNTSNCP
ncbi:hypothetical protein MY10362_008389 [Beauveria mimosiformis]